MSGDLETSSLSNDQSLAKSQYLNGQGFKSLVEAGMLWLKTNQQMVNALNVFPVPDGDTGTNMLLTMQAAYNEIAHSSEKNIGKVAHAVAQGALMGARGNSGVILSQLWRGFARTMDNLENLDAKTLVLALAESCNTAYKGVVRPVEGTILTVAKDISLAAEQALTETNDMLIILDTIIEKADQSVQRTPDLLPILKQAGVVDSGGKGLFFIFEGMQRYLKGLPLETPVSTIQPIAMMQEGTMEEIEPGQDYEVIVDFQPTNPLNLENFYGDLSNMGTSIQVGEGDGIYRMHIHVPTEKRYVPIDYVMGIGTITKVYIENLIAQMENKEKETATKPNFTTVEPGQIAVIAVSPGRGLTRIFASLGVAAVVEGGQTMNPSTEEILRAFENLPTDKIILLPNNKNVILAAQSAANSSVKHVKVIPTQTIPQGMSTLLRLDPSGDLEEIAAEMTEAINEVETGEITVATRTVEIDGVKVNEGDVIALLNGNLIDSSDNLETAILNLLKKSDIDDKERVTLFYGEGMQLNDVNSIADHIRENYPSYEVEIHDGGQPHYQFIISIE